MRAPTIEGVMKMENVTKVEELDGAASGLSAVLREPYGLRPPPAERLCVQKHEQSLALGSGCF